MARLFTSIFALFCALALTINLSHAQQLPDLAFDYPISAPTFSADKGPSVVLDIGHSPYAQRGNYKPFLKLLKADGYLTGTIDGSLTNDKLAGHNILVLVNAYRSDFSNFSVMEPPSAFDDTEIQTIVSWVKNGGRLFLIADHAPFSGGTAKLAEEFGYTFINSYVLKDEGEQRGSGKIQFERGKGLNAQHPAMTTDVGKTITHYVSFTGQAIIPPAEAMPLLTIPQGYLAVLTQRLRSERHSAPAINASSLSQGSTLEFGSGRLVIMGEAGGMSAQIVNGERKFGMNVEEAKHNPAFVRALLAWLAQGL